MSDGADLSTVLSALSDSGDLADRLGAILSGGEAASKLSEALGNEALGARLADMLKNADLSSILSLLGTAAGTPNEKSKSDEEAGNEDQSAIGAEAVSALPSIFGSLGKGRGMSKERRALLGSLKPFVSEKRRRAIDMLLGFDKLTAFLPGGK